MPRSRWFYRAVVLAGPLSVVALIAGWVTTEVGRQPWVVYRVMRTEEAVTGGERHPGRLRHARRSSTPASWVAVVWVLRRLGRAPLELPEEAAAMSLAEVPPSSSSSASSPTRCSAGADFGAGFWQLFSGASPHGRRVRTTRTTRWGRSGRPTTSG